MKVQFLGAAEGVTGSCYYIEAMDKKFIIDCGQFQGDLTEEKKNLEPFPFNPKDLDFIILTHAHIDHSGRLPKLVQLGYHNRIYMTRGTASLTEILLKDSAKIQAYENETENEKRKKAGLDLIEPYFTIDDVVDTLIYFNPKPYNEVIKLSDNMTLKFINAGHLLGSAHVLLTIDGTKYLFSGDIGTQHSQILIPPEPAPEADYIFMETTYGNKLHSDIEERFQKLYDIIMTTIQKKGTVIIPAFSVGRTQDIIYGLNQLKKRDAFFKIPFYVDSPMAIHATKIFTLDTEGMKPELVSAIQQKHRPFEMKNLSFIDDANKAFMLNYDETPKVIISASGMCDAGRILHHLKTYLEKPKTTVVFVGYQSEESLGRKIQNKESEVKILKDMVKHLAQVETLSGFSGHADQSELMHWLSKTHPKKIFLVHGETEGLNKMAELITERYGFDYYIPKLYEAIEL
ncbi:MAG: MBL fold metallo-hydrolase [Clostridia bacterium]|nr:MBL fold metallo-hydrolase [Clostridia bacterium]